MLKLKLIPCAIVTALLSLQGCGFHLPSEATLADTMPVVTHRQIRDPEAACGGR